MGLGAAASQLYGYLVDHGPTPTKDLQAVFGLGVDGTLAELREAGFVIGDPPAARAPERAFGPLLQVARSRVEALEIHVETMQDRWSANPANAGAPVVDRITTREELRKVYNRMDRRTQVEWMQVYTTPFEHLPPFTPPPEDHDPSALPVRRMIYERAILSSPGGLASIRNAADWGARIRIADEVPNKLIISDRKIALTPEEPRTTLPMLRTTSRALLIGLIAQFEADWEAATPLDLEASHVSAVPKELAPDDLVALQLVIAGEKLDSIARSMRCSRSTVQRRVTRMCELAGVKTKPQLVHYATKHWLS
jgi:DNA-binding CsgD family transcriptional regulator